MKLLQMHYNTLTKKLAQGSDSQGKMTLHKDVLFYSPLSAIIMFSQ